MNITKKLLLSFFLIVFLLNPSYAKWATIKDAPIKTSSTRNINVNSNGTSETIVETNVTILTELGRSLTSNFVLTYNDDAEKTEIIEAKTIYKGKEYKLDKKLIEDKPLASSPHGFDQKRQILLAFPNIEIGATIYLKYKSTLKKPPLDNFFSETFAFGAGELVDKTTIHIKSKLPLHILVNDPEKLLKINESKDLRDLKIELTKPIYNNAINEPKPLIVDEKHYTWASVSSMKNWENLAKEHGKFVVEKISQKLPESFQAILEKAKEKKNTIDQINTVTSLLNDRVRYMGDWRTVNGRFIPRDLKEISETQLGDCKDFSAATAAILNKLGFKAQAVAVRRGVSNISRNILPSFAAFNHLMLKVTDKNKKVYWIDPTNFSSMAGYTFPDIANKKVLIFDPSDPSYEKIPKVNHESSQIHLKRELEILDDNKVLETGSILLQNESAATLTGAALKVSNETIKDAIFDLLAGDIKLDEKNKKSMTIPDLKSRIVDDISIDYSFERENDILTTNVGPALKLTYHGGSISKIYNISEDFVSNSLAGISPSTYTKETIIKNVKVKNIEALNKKINTPWLFAKRECNFNKNSDLIIKDTFIFYKNIIPREDFKKPKFIKLKNWLRKNFKDVIIVFEPI